MKLLAHIELEGNPSTVTAQQNGIRVNKGIAYHYVKGKVQKAKVDLARQLIPYKPTEPFDGSLCLRVVWRFSRSSWENKAQRTTYKKTKPDLDNMVKGLADVMTGLKFWHDDNQLSRLELSKIWNEVGGLAIDILELTPEDYTDELRRFEK